MMQCKRKRDFTTVFHVYLTAIVFLVNGGYSESRGKYRYYYIDIFGEVVYLTIVIV